VGCEAWQMLPPGRQSGKFFTGTEVIDRSYYPFRKCIKPDETFTYIGCGGTLIKRSVYDKIGLFDEQFSPAYFEDPDFCYDKETQILTSRGIKYLKDVKVADIVLTMNDDGFLEYKPVLRTIKKYRSQLLHFQSRRVDIMCTHDQKLLVGYNRIPWGHDKGSFRDIDFVRADDIGDILLDHESRHFVRTAAGKWIGTETDYITLVNDETCEERTYNTEDFLRFMGWYLSEGHTPNEQRRRKARCSPIYICQSDKENQAKIISAINSMGHEAKNATNSYVFYDNFLASYLERFGYSYEKYIPDEIKKLSGRLLDIFLETYILGDGSRKPNGFSITTSSDRMKDDLVEILVKTQKPFTIHKTKGGAAKMPRGKIYVCRPVWQIQSYGQKHTDTTRAILNKPKEINYYDYTYDITVENHRIFIIRNGKGCWSSNCFRAIQAGFRLGWQPKCKIKHLAHQTIGTQKMFDKRKQFMRSYLRFRKKWNGFFPPPMRTPI